MLDSYYPRHGELERAEDLELDALQDRVRTLETLLTEAQLLVGMCDGTGGCNCVAARIHAALKEATHAASLA